MIKTFTKALKKISLLRRHLEYHNINPHEELTEHDQEMVQFYSQFVRPGELCFDVGANTGNRAKIFLKIGARVIAVEPQAECVRILRQKYGANENFKIVQTALGASDGKAEMLVSEASVISSLSPEWVQSVKTSGRFPGLNWDRKQTVSITTLDRLISEYGQPAFIKIDVEGFEFQVVSGLTRPIKSLSFEFTPEFLSATRNVITHLQQLGDARFNYSLGESMRLNSQEWINASAIEKILSGFKNDPVLFGDVYVKFPL